MRDLYFDSARHCGSAGVVDVMCLAHTVVSAGCEPLYYLPMV